MRKKICMLCLALACLLVLTACGCEHEWTEADCVTPKTCNLCQETEGEALGHTWVDATCTEAKTCSVCQQTEGEALGHVWKDADCENPKTCEVCAATEGEALGHTWIDATTESPKTCEVCNATEGDRIITDPRFTTDACAQVFGKWSAQIVVPAEQLGITGSSEEVVYDCVFTFRNDGIVTQSVAFADWDAVKELFRDLITQQVYSELSAMGITKDAAEESIKQLTGMTMDEYVDAMLAAMDPNSMMEDVTMVYYVDGTNLYMGNSWEEELVMYMFSMEGDKMTLVEMPYLIITELTRIVE